MLIITCPFCGPRSENEYIYGGPSKQRRPENASDCSNKEWVEYLTVSTNPVGPVSENWWHVRGCGEFVTVERDTLTHDITTASGKAVSPVSNQQGKPPSGQQTDNQPDENNAG